MNTYFLRTRALPLTSRRLAKAAISILSETIWDRELIYNMDLALSEACANVVRHAYRDMPPGVLEIRVTVNHPTDITLQIMDWGRGFPKWPMQIQNARPEAEGGRGLFIMSQLADEFSISQDEGANIIQLTLNIREDQWTSCE